MLNRRTVHSISTKTEAYKIRLHTLVPHANEIAVAATTDTTLAVLNLLSDIVTGLEDFQRTLTGRRLCFLDPKDLWDQGHEAIEDRNGESYLFVIRYHGAAPPQNSTQAPLSAIASTSKW